MRWAVKLPRLIGNGKTRQGKPAMGFQLDVGRGS